MLYYEQMIDFVQDINPWSVQGGADGKINYEKLSKDVSTMLLWIDPSLTTAMSCCTFPSGVVGSAEFIQAILHSDER
jgi:hypothetical protein